MEHFKQGFEKEAFSLIGKAKNMASGLRKFEHGGVIKNPAPILPGHSIAPKAIPTPLATFAKVAPKHNTAASLPFKKVM